MNVPTSHPPTTPPPPRGCVILLPLLAAVLAIAGCATVPKNGALLAGKLHEGIERNQLETEKIIAALADTQRAILAEKWKPLYRSIEEAYMEKHGVTDERNLTQDQRRAIAVQSGNVWERLRGEIDAVEADLVKQSRANTAQLVEINSTIQKYLLSLEKLDAAQSAVAGRLQSVTGVNFSSLSGLAEKIVSEFNPKALLP